MSEPEVVVAPLSAFVEPVPERRDLVAVAPTPMLLLQAAIERGMDIDKLEKLFDLNERWEAKLARGAYIQAMARFKSECPSVLAKDSLVNYPSSKGAVTYRHASLGGILAVVTPHLSANGLSASWSLAQDAGYIEVSCWITHIGGHRESATMRGPRDDSGGKNALQQIGSAQSYLERYTFLAVAGLGTGDIDDDAQGSAAKPPASKPKADPPAQHKPEAVDAARRKQRAADEAALSPRQKAGVSAGKPDDVLRKEASEFFVPTQTQDATAVRQLADGSRLKPDPKPEPAKTTRALRKPAKGASAPIGPEPEPEGAGADAYGRHEDGSITARRKELLDIVAGHCNSLASVRGSCGRDVWLEFSDGLVSREKATSQKLAAVAKALDAELLRVVEEQTQQAEATP